MVPLLFRAINKQTNLWVYSKEVGIEYFFKNCKNGTYIKESISQYSGLNDKFNKPIYDKDIVNQMHTDFEVFFENGCFKCGKKPYDVILHTLISEKNQDQSCEIVGNIFNIK